MAIACATEDGDDDQGDQMLQARTPCDVEKLAFFT